MQRIQIRLMNPKNFDLAISAASINKNTVIYDGREQTLPDAILPRLGANIDYFVSSDVCCNGIVLFVLKQSL